MILREYREQLYYKSIDKKEKGRNSVKDSLSELSQENTDTCVALYLGKI